MADTSDVTTPENSTARDAEAQPRAVWLTWLIGLVATAGLFDAILLTVEHYTNYNLPCTISHGCQTVLSSKYAMVGPVPTAMLGVAFYALILFAVVYALSNRTRLEPHLLLAWTALGFISSLGLTYIQAFIIHAWCQYCLLSGLSSTLLFILAIAHYLRPKEV